MAQGSIGFSHSRAAKEIAEDLRGRGADERHLRIELAKHLLSVVTRSTPKSISRGYVSCLFDRFSKTFDASLDSLNYRVPQVLMQAGVA